MPGFLKRLGAPLAFAGLLLLATITMVRDRGEAGRTADRDLGFWQGLLLEVAMPLQRVVSVPYDGVRSAWARYLDLVGVRDENERLRERIALLEDENLQYREALVASRHLEQIAAMREDFETPLLPSAVVGLDVSPWFRSLLVDRGSNHGVLAGQPVVTEQGVVGLITRTSPHAAKTMLLLDRQSQIDAVVQRSRARGILRGLGTDTLEFEFVVRDSDVVIGDTVITSGLGGVYPKGLRLGEIVSLEDPGGRLLQLAAVRPAVDFGRLEQVFVMLRRGPTLELLYGSNVPDDPAPADRAQSPASAAKRTETAGLDGEPAPEAPPAS